MNYIEKLIARKVSLALIKAGMPVTVDYNEDSQLTQSVDTAAILREAEAVDECWFLVKPDKHGKYDSFVYFIWGNGNGGWDCISDYSMSLEPALKPVLDWIEKEEGK